MTEQECKTGNSEIKINQNTQKKKKKSEGGRVQAKQRIQELTKEQQSLHTRKGRRNQPSNSMTCTPPAKTNKQTNAQRCQDKTIFKVPSRCS